MNLEKIKQLLFNSQSMEDLFIAVELTKSWNPEKFEELGFALAEKRAVDQREITYTCWEYRSQRRIDKASFINIDKGKIFMVADIIYVTTPIPDKIASTWGYKDITNL